MARQRRSPEQIIRLLKHADVLASQGKTVEMICREISVSDATYCSDNRLDIPLPPWRKAFLLPCPALIISPYSGFAVETALL